HGARDPRADGGRRRHNDRDVVPGIPPDDGAAWRAVQIGERGPLEAAARLSRASAVLAPVAVFQRLRGRNLSLCHVQLCCRQAPPFTALWAVILPHFMVADERGGII